MAPPESGQSRGQRVPTQKRPKRPGRALLTVTALLLAALTATTTGSASAGSFDNGTIDLVASWTSSIQIAGGPAISIGNEPAWEGRPLLVRDQQLFSLPQKHLAQIYMVTPSGALQLVYDGEADWGQCAMLTDANPQGAGWMCGLTRITRGFDGSLYVYAQTSNRIFRKPPIGGWEHIAGNSVRASTGDGGPATSASLALVHEMAAGPDGSLYVSEPNRVRRIHPSGVITAFAGTGAAGNSGDGGPALDATFEVLTGLVVDAEVNVYIADNGSRRVRVVGTDGVIRPFAGTGVQGFSGDGGSALDADLNGALRLAAAPSGEVAISTTGRVRAVDADGVIDTIVGNGTVGTGGDGGPAIDAELQPLSFAFDQSGQLFIRQPLRLRVVTWVGSLGGTASVGGAPGGAGVHVAVLEPWPSWKPVASTFTGAGGSWSIPELKTGTYTVRFFDPWGRYQRQWLGGSASYRDAAVVQVTGGLAAADVTLEARAGLLSGLITDAATTEPVQGAVVWIIRDGAYVTARVSDANGQWSIGDLPTGSYMLRFTHPTPWLYKGMWHHNAAALADATPVVIGPDPIQLTTELGGW